MDLVPLIFTDNVILKWNTLTIIKSKNGSIFGGYLDKAWDSIDAWRCDCNAFLYSLINKNNKPFKAKIYSRDGFNAINCNPLHGPIFGSGCDIFISTSSKINSNSYCNFGYTYRHPDYRYQSTELNLYLPVDFHFKQLKLKFTPKF